MIQALCAIEYLRAWLTIAPAPDAAAQPRKRRKLKPRRRPYAGPVRIDADAPILSQLRGGMHG